MRTSRLALAALVVVFGAVVVPASAVSATSCVGWNGLTWETVADGSAVLVAEGLPDQEYFDQYDTVVVGMVTRFDPETYTDDNGAEIAGVAVTLSVVGALRTGEIGETYVLNQPDMGAMSGYPFVVGTTYMVPLHDAYPGRVNLCDAVLRVTPEEAEQSLAVAAESGVEVAFPTAGAGDATTTVSVVGETEETTASDSDASAAWRAPARWLGVALVVALVGLVARRRGSRSGR